MSRKYLLDTGPAFDLMFRRRGVHERARQARASGARVGICVPVLGEVIAGIEGSATRDENLPIIRRGLSGFILWPYTKEAAEEYGHLFTELRRIGRPMQQIDIQLAAVALTLGNCTVVTTDSDLAAVPGLSTENWAAPVP